MSSKHEIVKCREKVTSRWMELPKQRHRGFRDRLKSGELNSYFTLGGSVNTRRSKR